MAGRLSACVRVAASRAHRGARGSERRGSGLVNSLLVRRGSACVVNVQNTNIIACFERRCPSPLCSPSGKPRRGAALGRAGRRARRLHRAAARALCAVRRRAARARAAGRSRHRGCGAVRPFRHAVLRGIRAGAAHPRRRRRLCRRRAARICPRRHATRWCAAFVSGAAARCFATPAACSAAAAAADWRRAVQIKADRQCAFRRRLGIGRHDKKEVLNAPRAQRDRSGVPH